MPGLTRHPSSSGSLTFVVVRSTWPTVRPRLKAGVTGFFAPAVPLLLQDVRRAAVPGEEVGTVLGRHERLQRPDPGEEANEVVLAAEREHGVDQVVADAGLALLDLEAVGEEGGQCIEDATHCPTMFIVGMISHAMRDVLSRKPRQSAADPLVQAQSQVVARQQLQHADCRSAQCERVLGTSRRHFGEEKSDERIQLVRQTHRHRRRRGRHLVALPDRLVVVADGGDDAGVFLLGGGVIAAHHALELGELADHAGDEIGLAEPRGAFGEVCQFGRAPLSAFSCCSTPAKAGAQLRDVNRLSASLRCRLRSNWAPAFAREGGGTDGTAILAPNNPFLDQPSRKLGDAVDLVGHRAELLVEDDAVELIRLLLHGHAQILLVEEARVRQAGGEDLAVAFDDLRATVGRVDVGGADEGVGERAVGVAADEIFLVHPRGQLDDLGRDGEERRIEAVEQRHGPFGQAGVLGDEALVLDEAQAGVAGEVLRAGADQRLAFGLIDDDVAGAQLLGIVYGRADRDRAGVVEAVP